MIIGIDLGTTNSLASVWRDGGPVLIPNPLGELLTPSCVSIDQDGGILVGQAARERLQTHPHRTASVFKRHMGSEKTYRLAERDYRPEELSALVLKALKLDAEAFLGTEITEAIITVPAYFSEAQRQATRAAGKIAGLRVERLLNEPTAAALAYGLHKLGADTRFLVFDLGGGTFDVSILEMFEGVMEVRASAGDNFLGGEDFRDVLVRQFFEKAGVPETLRSNPLFMQRCVEAAERAKKALSTARYASMQIGHGSEEYAAQLEESAFESGCADLLLRLRTPVERALRDTRLRSSELDDVVLVGGATRMPMVRKLATTMFGRFPSSHFDPDHVVALGAAVQAGLKAKDKALDDVVMTDVAPYSLGIEVVRRLSDGSISQGHFDPLIERNSVVPVSRVKNYAPVRQGQKQLALEIYQGESRMVRDNIRLGTLAIELPPKASIQECATEVRFTYDVNGLLQVEATLSHTGQTSSLVVEGNPGLLSEAEIAERLKALEQLKIHPRESTPNRTLLARAERIYQLLKGPEREWLDLQISEFERVLASQDERQIATARRALSSQLDQLTQQPVLDDEQ